MKIALIHEWLISMRGGEKVLLELCRLFPDADVYTLLHLPGTVDADIEVHRIQSSFIQKIPGSTRHFRKMLPLFPIAIESFDLTPYDVVISSSHCAAKGVITRPEALHISYIHSPMRYIWDMHFSYFPHGQGNPLARMLYRGFSNYLRMWDVTASSRVDKIIANSQFVAQRIWKYYRRKATVIPPPVDIDRFDISRETANYYVAFSSLVPYKRIDLAVRAFNELRLPLKVIGDGSEQHKLEKLAGPNIEFLAWLSDRDLSKVLARAKALVFPGVEDFGIIPVEANACGVPVIAFGAGGVLDSIIPLEENGDQDAQPTGVFFNEQTTTAIMAAVEHFERHENCFENRLAIRQTTFRFRPALFRRRIMAYVTKAARQRGIDLGQEIIFNAKHTKDVFYETT